eukprot:TRINITY_DN2713_c1_g1_i5.p1 TRINITY_DN2713_c1_g1~~TRINITY_DN2713_c1_g1_i5.p1  ORF type:complete len:240 (-),score=92.01 TRINITY_DN2713_c1_g1_i5:109-828(-)
MPSCAAVRKLVGRRDYLQKKTLLSEKEAKELACIGEAVEEARNANTKRMLADQTKEVTAHASKEASSIKKDIQSAVETLSQRMGWDGKDWDGQDWNYEDDSFDWATWRAAIESRFEQLTKAEELHMKCSQELKQTVAVVLKIHAYQKARTGQLAEISEGHRKCCEMQGKVAKMMEYLVCHVHDSSCKRIDDIIKRQGELDEAVDAAKKRHDKLSETVNGRLQKMEAQLMRAMEKFDLSD